MPQYSQLKQLDAVKNLSYQQAQLQQQKQVKINADGHRQVQKQLAESKQTKQKMDMFLSNPVFSAVATTDSVVGIIQQSSPITEQQQSRMSASNLLVRNHSSRIKINMKPASSKVTQSTTLAPQQNKPDAASHLSNAGGVSKRQVSHTPIQNIKHQLNKQQHNPRQKSNNNTHNVEPLQEMISQQNRGSEYKGVASDHHLIGSHLQQISEQDQEQFRIESKLNASKFATGRQMDHQQQQQLLVDQQKMQNLKTVNRKVQNSLLHLNGSVQQNQYLTDYKNFEVVASESKQKDKKQQISHTVHSMRYDDPAIHVTPKQPETTTTKFSKHKTAETQRPGKQFKILGVNNNVFANKDSTLVTPYQMTENVLLANPLRTKQLTASTKFESQNHANMLIGRSPTLPGQQQSQSNTREDLPKLVALSQVRASHGHILGGGESYSHSKITSSVSNNYYSASQLKNIGGVNVAASEYIKSTNGVGLGFLGHSQSQYGGGAGSLIKQSSIEQSNMYVQPILGSQQYYKVTPAAMNSHFRVGTGDIIQSQSDKKVPHRSPILNMQHHSSASGGVIVSNNSQSSKLLPKISNLKDSQGSKVMADELTRVFPQLNQTAEGRNQDSNKLIAGRYSLASRSKHSNLITGATVNSLQQQLDNSGSFKPKLQMNNHSLSALQSQSIVAPPDSITIDINAKNTELGSSSSIQAQNFRFVPMNNAQLAQVSLQQKNQISTSQQSFQTVQIKVPALEGQDDRQPKRTKSNMKAPKVSGNRVELVSRKPNNSSQVKVEPANDELFAEFSGVGKNSMLTHTKSQQNLEPSMMAFLNLLKGREESKKSQYQQIKVNPYEFVGMRPLKKKRPANVDSSTKQQRVAAMKSPNDHQSSSISVSQSGRPFQASKKIFQKQGSSVGQAIKTVPTSAANRASREQHRDKSSNVGSFVDSDNNNNYNFETAAIAQSQALQQTNLTAAGGKVIVAPLAEQMQNNHNGSSMSPPRIMSPNSMAQFNQIAQQQEVFGIIDIQTHPQQQQQSDHQQTTIQERSAQIKHEQLQYLDRQSQQQDEVVIRSQKSINNLDDYRDPRLRVNLFNFKDQQFAAQFGQRSGSSNYPVSPNDPALRKFIQMQAVRAPVKKQDSIKNKGSGQQRTTGKQTPNMQTGSQPYRVNTEESDLQVVGIRENMMMHHQQQHEERNQIDTEHFEQSQQIQGNEFAPQQQLYIQIQASGTGSVGEHSGMIVQSLDTSSYHNQRQVVQPMQVIQQEYYDNEDVTTEFGLRQRSGVNTKQLDSNREQELQLLVADESQLYEGQTPGLKQDHEMTADSRSPQDIVDVNVFSLMPSVVQEQPTQQQQHQPSVATKKDKPSTMISIKDDNQGIAIDQLSLQADAKSTERPALVKEKMTNQLVQSKLDEVQFNNELIESDKVKHFAKMTGLAFKNTYALPSVGEKKGAETYRLFFKRRHTVERTNLIIIKASDLLLATGKMFEIGGKNNISSSQEEVLIRPDILQLIAALLPTNQIAIFIDYTDHSFAAWVNSLLMKQLQMQVDAVYTYNVELINPSELLIDVTQIVNDFRLFSKFQQSYKKTLHNQSLFTFVEAAHKSVAKSQLIYNKVLACNYTHVALGQIDLNKEASFQTLLNYLITLNIDYSTESDLIREAHVTVNEQHISIVEQQSQSKQSYMQIQASNVYPSLVNTEKQEELKKLVAEMRQRNTHIQRHRATYTAQAASNNHYLTMHATMQQSIGSALDTETVTFQQEEQTLSSFKAASSEIAQIIAGTHLVELPSRSSSVFNMPGQQTQANNVFAQVKNEKTLDDSVPHFLQTDQACGTFANQSQSQSAVRTPLKPNEIDQNEKYATVIPTPNEHTEDSVLRKAEPQPKVPSNKKFKHYQLICIGEPSDPAKSVQLFEWLATRVFSHVAKTQNIQDWLCKEQFNNRVVAEHDQSGLIRNEDQSFTTINNMQSKREQFRKIMTETEMQRTPSMTPTRRFHNINIL